MSKLSELSEDQQKRVAATLARIRGGLNALSAPSEEPAHIFTPESFDASRK